jgi:hypothetical protein
MAANRVLTEFGEDFLPLAVMAESNSLHENVEVL